MIKQEMTIGPKGQVVIPQLIRENLHLHPGSKVVIKLDKDRILIEKPFKVDLKLLEEGYKRTAKRDLEISKEFKNIDSEHVGEW